MIDDETTAPAEPAHGIAIVGMAGRFPGARDLAEFWANLAAGVESVRFFSDEELLAAGAEPTVLAHDRYVRAKAVLADVDLFDAAFFGFTPREAELMDPQHRILLECAWEALEDAGYDAARVPGRVAVYAGSGTSTYLLSNLLPNRELMERVGTLQAILANDRDFLATRISYKLDLRGPSILVQTACSTALAAVHMSCQSLLAGESDMALAGGVSISVPTVTGYVYQEGSVMSPDGHCRAFDAAAGGSVEGNGAGVVVLKRLADALADGDHVYAVILGSAANNDGSTKVGFTAPSVQGQTEVIAESLLMAGVEPDDMGYVEAHGSGTPLGDPIEITALTQAFRAATDRTGFCAVGSVKTNVGHLNAAAGVAGLVKAVLALANRTIPPSLHFEHPNPQIDFAASPFFVPTRALPWEGPLPRRAGVSSFGLGGTNVHAVLEEAPTPRPGSATTRPWQLLVLSARTGAALDAATARLAAHLEAHPEIDLADAAWTLQVGRRAFDHRRVLVCRDREDAVTALTAGDPRRLLTGLREPGERQVAFLFPGLGDHYPGMARELYATEPTFRAEVDRCTELLAPRLGTDVREAIFSGMGDVAVAGPGRQTDLRALLRRATDGPPGRLAPPDASGRPKAAHEDASGGASRPVDTAALRLSQTWVAQPAVFVVEYALARLLMEWGIKPSAMIGYSIGEYVAACLAGVLPLDSAIALVAERAKLIQALPGGAMLAVPLPEAEVVPLLGARLSLAATNGPHFSVVGGPEEAVAELEARLAGRGAAALRLTTTHAFHSRMLEPAVAAVTALARSFEPRPPQIPYLSNVTGTWATAADLADPAYWARHMCGTVRFAEGLAELLAEPSRLLLEVGPGSTLTTLVRQHPGATPGRVALSTLRRASEEGSDSAGLLEALGRLWLAGAAVDWQGVSAHERRRRVPLPTYPFERSRCWIDPPRRSVATSQERLEAAAAPGTTADPGGWFYAPGWQLAPLAASPPFGVQPAAGEPWLVFLDRSGLGDRMVAGLRRRGNPVTAVVEDESAEGLAGEGDLYALAPARRAGYDALLARLRAEGGLPRRIVHLWTVTPGPPEGLDRVAWRRHRDAGVASLMLLAQALAESGAAEPVALTVVSNRREDVADGEPLEPGKAAVVAACKVIHQEYPNVACRAVDVALPTAERDGAELAARLLAEAAALTPAAPGGPAVAWRGRRRWVRSWEPVRLPPPPETPADPETPESGRLRRGGAYLLTDGAHGLGPALAESLLRRCGARLALAVPPDLPPRSEWERRLTGVPVGATAAQDPVAATLRRLLALEALGEVWTVAADPADPEQLGAALAAARARFGGLHGVFHTAGSTAGGLVQLRTAEALAAALAPQVEGALALAAVLLPESPPLDFVALCSSTLAIAGGLGQLEIAAGGAVLDALAEVLAAAGAPVVALHWDPYQWDGWLVAGLGSVTGIEASVGQDLSAHAVAAEASTEALERALAAGLPRLAVTGRDLAGLIRDTDAFTAATLLAEMERARHAEPVHRRELATPYVPPRDELEEKIAAVWQELFGIDRIGVHDNFLELGGHSLLAIQVATHLRTELDADLPVTAIFEAPTVAELAQAIAASRSAAEQDLEALLAAVEGLSPEEALERMAKEMGAGA